MSGRIVVVLGIACACSGSLRARPAGADYLEAIRIEGNRALATGALEPALALHETIREGAAIDPYLLAADTERIRIAYWKRGFFEARVSARVERRDRAQVAVFAVVEGRRAVTRVEITGLPPELSPARARALVALRDGAPFDYEVYKAGELALRAAIENAGYAHADVPGTVLADPARGMATVRYDVVPRERCRFGAIRIAGTVRPELVEAVRRRIGFAPGDRYSVAALEQARADIFELGRFSTVQLVPDRSGGDSIDVTVELAEASRHAAHLGGGVGYDPVTLEGRARAGISWVPASHPLLTVATEARAAVTAPHDLDTDQADPKLRVLATLRRLDLFRPRIRGELEAGIDYQVVEAYTWTGKHGRVGLGLPLGRRWLQLHLGWRIQQLEFSDIDTLLTMSCDGGRECCTTTAQELGICEAQRIGAYQASLVADLRDNPIEPRRGAYLDLRVASGTRFAGSELTFLQLTPELRGYVSLGGLVIAGRARVGAILGDVPVIERYYSGGASGHRGFPARRLSPVATAMPCDAAMPCGGAAVVIGGAGLIETGIELRRKLGDWPIGVNVFLDGGDVTRSLHELDPSNLHWAVGAGLWWQPVADLKIRFDVGCRLNRTESGTSQLCLDNRAWHIGVGDSY